MGIAYPFSVGIERAATKPVVVGAERAGSQMQMVLCKIYPELVVGMIGMAVGMIGIGADRKVVGCLQY